jgi:ankyrin repeat protein
MSNASIPTLPIDSWFGAVQRQFKGTLIDRMGRGESVDQVDGSGMTALMHAVKAGHLDFAHWLLCKGANPSHVGPDQSTALQLACENASEGFKLSKLLLQWNADIQSNPKGRAALAVLAILRADIELLTLTLNKGLDPNEAVRNGFSAIEYASMQKDVDLIELLLNRGGDVNGRGSDHEFSPLMLSLYKKNPDVAEFLFDAGANPLARYWHPDQPDLVLMASDLAKKSAPALYPRLKALEAELQAQALDAIIPTISRSRQTRL